MSGHFSSVSRFYAAPAKELLYSVILSCGLAVFVLLSKVSQPASNLGCRLCYSLLLLFRFYQHYT